MSHTAYDDLWLRGQVELADLLPVELPKDPPKPEKDKLVAFQKFATMYIKYILIFRKLEESYDQIVHPQKRRTIRHLLDGVIGRVLELKNEMVTLELLEFHYFDDILSDMKLTPSDVEVPIPRYFLSENAKTIKEREKLLGTILAKMGPPDLDKTEGDQVTMTTEEAVRLIQVHERARQGRLRAKLMKEIRVQEERERQAQLRGAPKIDSNVAATLIQKVWRGYWQRKVTAKLRAEELVLLGMKSPPPPKSQKNTNVYLSKKIEEKRHQVQQQHEKEFQEALVAVKDRLRDVEGPDMRERMQDQIRQWMIEVRDATGKFPEYPSVDEGGSLAIFKPRVEGEVHTYVHV